MQKFNFLEKELLDIVFKGRNQQYGAYVLRKTYPQQVRNSVLITGAILLSFLALYFAGGGKTDVGITVPDYDNPAIISSVVLPKQNAGKAGPVQKTETVQNKKNPYKVVENTSPVTTPIETPTVSAPPVIAVGNGPTNGPITDPGLGGVDPGGIGAPSSGGGEAVVIKKTVPPMKPLIVAQVMPAFPGGEDAMMEYLQRKIKYPKLAISRGVMGIVYVEFVVGRNGKIRNVKVLNSVGAGCDEEAMRVIRSMPAWKPGMQDGNKVDVSFSIPVEFEL